MSSRNFMSIAVMFTSAVVYANAMAIEHWVGDSSGWTTDYDYQAWANKRIFRVGDTLVFNYTEGLHNVFKVDGDSFKNCLVLPSNEPLTSGHDAITLKTPGKKWYICGVGKHCAEHNQKLVINVVDDGGAAPAPAPIPMAPPSSNPPPKNSAHGVVTSAKHQILVTAAVAIACTVFHSLT